MPSETKDPSSSAMDRLSPSVQFALFTERVDNFKAELTRIQTGLETNGNLVRDLISTVREVEKQSITGDKFTTDFRTRLMIEIDKMIQSREKLEALRSMIHDEFEGFKTKISNLSTMSEYSHKDIQRVVNGIETKISQFDKSMTDLLTAELESLTETMSSLLSPINELETIKNDLALVKSHVFNIDGCDDKGIKFSWSMNFGKLFWQGARSFGSNIIFAGILLLIVAAMIFLPKIFMWLAHQLMKG